MGTVLAQSFSFQISDLKLTLDDRKYSKESIYVNVSVGQSHRRTNSSLKLPSGDVNKWRWSDPLLVFKNEKEMHLTLSIVRKAKVLFARLHVSNDKTMGELAKPVDLSSNLDHYELPVVNKKKAQIGSIEFSLKFEQSNLHSAASSLTLLSEQESARASKLGLSSPVQIALEAPIGAVEAVKAVEDDGSDWQVVIDKIGLAVEILDGIAKIHPYAQMAWSIISPPLKMAIKQNKRDQKIKELLGAMNDAFDFAGSTNAIPELDDRRREVINQLSKQTYECAHFIRDYISLKYGKRFIKGATTNHDTKVDEFISAFKRLKQNFQEQSSIMVEVVSHRTLLVAESISMNQNLSGMYCADGLDLARECLPGTRKTILSEITEWANRVPSEKEEQSLVYWLTGPPGCGKSAIASSIAQHFRSIGRCAPFFFPSSFQVGLDSDASVAPPKKTPQAIGVGARANNLFSTLSRELADLDEGWKLSLVEVIKNDSDLRKTGDIERQFEKLILEPARDFRPLGPILVVIDGLDRCFAATEEDKGDDDDDDDADSEKLLDMLARLDELKECGLLRFLITSRPDRDIVARFKDKSWVVRKDLAVDVATDSEALTQTDEDVRRFVDAELSGLEYLLEEWPDEKPWLDVIAAQAEHSFLRAQVACDYVRGLPTSDPVDRFEDIRDGKVDLGKLVEDVVSRQR